MVIGLQIGKLQKGAESALPHSLTDILKSPACLGLSKVAAAEFLAVGAGGLLCFLDSFYPNLSLLYFPYILIQWL